MNAYEAFKRIETLEERNKELREIINYLKQREQQNVIWAIINEYRTEIRKLDKAVRDLKVELD